MMEITSAKNQAVKDVSALVRLPKARRERGQYVIEGEVTIRAAVQDAGLKLRTVVYSDDYSGEIPRADKTFCVTRDTFSKISDTVSPQGILAVVDTVTPSLHAPSGNAVILDGIRDPGNMGTILRTCAALGITDAYLIDCVDPTNPKSVRSSMTGIFFVNCYECDADAAIDTVKSKCDLLCADMGGENLFDAPRPNKNFALIIGNEAHGVSEKIKKACDKVFALPMERIESLNAAVSGSVILYHLIHAKGV